jgi:hypothetical protein
LDTTDTTGRSCFIALAEVPSGLILAEVPSGLILAEVPSGLICFLPFVTVGFNHRMS